MARIQAKEVIKVALDVGMGIGVPARARPARLVAYGATVGVAVLTTAVGYGAYALGLRMLERARRPSSTPR